MRKPASKSGIEIQTSKIYIPLQRNDLTEKSRKGFSGIAHTVQGLEQLRQY